MSTNSDTTPQDINLAMATLKLGSKDFINNLPNELLLRIVEFADVSNTAWDEQRDRYARVGVNARWFNMWRNGTYVVTDYCQAVRFLAMLEGNVGRAQEVERFVLTVQYCDWSNRKARGGRGLETFNSLFSSLPSLHDFKLIIPSSWPGDERMFRSLAGLTKMRKFNLAFGGNSVDATLDYVG
jgi:hypothetical protein